jgi:uncharacterized protein (DUF433 family)
MHEDPLLQRITVNPGIFGGKPIIRGRRLAVETVLGMLAVGDTMETLLEGYPWLEREDILACLAFAQDEADVVSEVSVNEASPMTARVEPQDPSPRDREGVLSALRDL